jgi:Xaa-Pro aminopeptidase
MQLQKSLKGILSLLSGESHLDKLRRLREDLVKKKAKAMVVTMLDEVAWLFNLRGSDIDYNPGE